MGELLDKIKNWYESQTPTAKGMIWLLVILIIGIIVRWDYVSGEILKSFNFLNN